MPVRLLPEMLDPQRIGPDQQRLQILQLAEHRIRLPAQRRLAQPGQPLVGLDQHEDVIPPPAPTTTGRTFVIRTCLPFRLHLGRGNLLWLPFLAASLPPARNRFPPSSDRYNARLTT